MFFLIINFLLLIIYVFGAIYLINLVKIEKMKYHNDERWYKIRFLTNQRLEDINHLIPMILLFTVLVFITLDIKTFRIDIATFILLLVLICREFVENFFILKYDKTINNKEKI